MCCFQTKKQALSHHKSSRRPPINPPCRTPVGESRGSPPAQHARLPHHLRNLSQMRCWRRVPYTRQARNTTVVRGGKTAAPPQQKRPPNKLTTTTRPRAHPVSTKQPRKQAKGTNEWPKNEKRRKKRKKNVRHRKKKKNTHTHRYTHTHHTCEHDREPVLRNLRPGGASFHAPRPQNSETAPASKIPPLVQGLITRTHAVFYRWWELTQQVGGPNRLLCSPLLSSSRRRRRCLRFVGASTGASTGATDAAQQPHEELTARPPPPPPPRC